MNYGVLIVYLFEIFIDIRSFENEDKDWFDYYHIIYI